MYPETTLARCYPGPDQGGPRSGSVEHPPREQNLWNTICSRWFPNLFPSTRVGNKKCSRQCSGTLGGLCVFAVSGTFLFPNSRLVFPILFPTARPWNKKCSRLPVPPRAGSRWTTECEMYPETPPLPMPHRAGSRRTTDCDMYLARTLTPCPVRPEQGAPRSARSTRKPPFPGVP